MPLTTSSRSVRSVRSARSARPLSSPNPDASSNLNLAAQAAALTFKKSELQQQQQQQQQQHQKELQRPKVSRSSSSASTASSILLSHNKPKTRSTTVTGSPHNRSPSSKNTQFGRFPSHSQPCLHSTSSAPSSANQTSRVSVDLKSPPLPTLGRTSSSVPHNMVRKPNNGSESQSDFRSSRSAGAITTTNSEFNINRSQTSSSVGLGISKKKTAKKTTWNSVNSNSSSVALAAASAIAKSRPKSMKSQDPSPAEILQRPSTVPAPAPALYPQTATSKITMMNRSSSSLNRSPTLSSTPVSPDHKLGSSHLKIHDVGVIPPSPFLPPEPEKDPLSASPILPPKLTSLSQPNSALSDHSFFTPPSPMLLSSPYIGGTGLAHSTSTFSFNSSILPPVSEDSYNENENTSATDKNEITTDTINLINNNDNNSNFQNSNSNMSNNLSEMAPPLLKDDSLYQLPSPVYADYDDILAGYRFSSTSSFSSADESSAIEMPPTPAPASATSSTGSYFPPPAPRQQTQNHLKHARSRSLNRKPPPRLDANAIHSNTLTLGNSTPDTLVTEIKSATSATSSKLARKPPPTVDPISISIPEPRHRSTTSSELVAPIRPPSIGVPRQHSTPSESDVSHYEWSDKESLANDEEESDQMPYYTLNTRHHHHHHHHHQHQHHRHGSQHAFSKLLKLPNKTATQSIINEDNINANLTNSGTGNSNFNNDNGNSGSNIQHQLKFRTTMRKGNHGRRNKAKNSKAEFNETKPWKHHNDSKSITKEEKKRYEGVWASNRGKYVSPEIQGYADLVHGLVVREVWKRSKLEDEQLSKVWLLLKNGKEDDGVLNKLEFIVGLWLIDQCLYGKKLPDTVSREVWISGSDFGDIEPQKAKKRDKLIKFTRK
ncbi:unnamed protein product [Ambrosiozyma monospora]|uniref:Unnamed protein product n=1 Tax=Ambrosiozyma monospora TaxID=43982 RepID=A0A9W6YSC3_AMBMO|nr:unnamed protein product [Ambrosiozyma monospora]